MRRVTIEAIKDPDSDFSLAAPNERLTMLGLADLLSSDECAPDVYGRDDHVEQMTRLLRSGRGVLLRGPSGAGKTTLLRATAALLRDAGLVVARTSIATVLEGMRYAGDLECKVNALVDALTERAAPFGGLLYLTDIVALPRAGTSQYWQDGLLSALRPALDARCVALIGECTDEEFAGGGHTLGLAGSLAACPSLLSLLTIVAVCEPEQEVEQTIVEREGAMRGDRYGMTIAPETIELALRVGRRVRPERALPGQALDLLDEALRLHGTAPIPSNPINMTLSEDTEGMLDLPLPSVPSPTGAWKHQGTAVGHHLAGRKTEEGLSRPMPEPCAASQLGRLQHPAALPERPLLDPTLLATTIIQRFHLPRWFVSDHESLHRVEVQDFFSRHLIGQSDAVETVVDRLLLLKAELIDVYRPLGVLLFVGPTGTGKTWLAMTLAAFLYPAAPPLVRLDMSSYSQQDHGALFAHDLAAGLRPHSLAVVLLDEIEKAAPPIHDLLLQAFDHGHLATASGEVVALRNSLLIMTSNLGADLRPVDGERAIGFLTAAAAAPVGQLTQSMAHALADAFRPELLGRIDAVVPFQPLDLTARRDIVRRELAIALRREGLLRRCITVTYGVETVDWLARHGTDPQHGARPLQRVINSTILRARRTARRRP